MATPATTLGQLLRIRDHHQGFLQGLPGGMGSALGLAEDGRPCIMVFVENKVAPKWVSPASLVPRELSTPNGVSCPVSVIEGTSAPDIALMGRTPDGRDVRLSMAQLRDEVPLDAARHQLRSHLRGWSPRLFPGSQVASAGPGAGLREGTLTCLVRHRQRGRLGLLTNEHVAGAPGTLLHHPTPHGRVIGTTYASIDAVTDESRFPGHVDQPGTYYSVDAAFVDLHDDLGPDDLDARLPYLRDDGTVELRRLAEPFTLALDGMEPVGRSVVSVGRSRSFQRGRVAGVAYCWVSEHGRQIFTDYLVVGEAGASFSAPGDSGKLIVIEDGDRLVPMALLWGGWQGELYLPSPQSKWSYATDLHTALELLGAELVRG